MTYSSSDKANTVYTELLSGVDLSLPDIDLDSDAFKLPSDFAIQTAEKLTIDELTQNTLNPLLGTVKLHLQNEFEQGRITGSEYTKAYIAAIEAAMNTSLQFVLQRESNYWQAINSQIAAVTAITNLEVAKYNLAIAKYQALQNSAAFALAKLKLATEDVAYETAQYNLNTILPIQAELAQKQVDTTDYNLNYLLPLEKQTKEYALAHTLPKQTELLISQIDSSEYTRQFLLVSQYETSQYNLNTLLVKQGDKLDADKDSTLYNTNYVLPAQVAKITADKLATEYTTNSILPKQATLLTEQGEAQRAQTLNTRSDGITAIEGVLGAQKNLYAQQVTSYKQDAQLKGVKLYTDALLANVAILGGGSVPDSFSYTSVEALLVKHKTDNNLV